MEDSILISTKKVLGIAEDYTAFDLDVITHINAAFAVLNQLGIGPTIPIYVEDDSLNWADVEVPLDQISMIRTYIFLKVRMLFDPPTTSFHIEAMNNQIAEFENRLSYSRENLIPLVEVVEEEV